eukprot:Skav231677  [mRNA]  locus=scaffold597:412923:418446:+ [translate_table: standard]
MWRWKANTAEEINSYHQQMEPKAMQDVKLILDSEKSMVLPQQTHHTYEDKFHLVERCSLVTLASHWNTLEQLGLTTLGSFGWSSSRR